MLGRYEGTWASLGLLAMLASALVTQGSREIPVSKRPKQPVSLEKTVAETPAPRVVLYQLEDRSSIAAFLQHIAYPGEDVQRLHILSIGDARISAGDRIDLYGTDEIVGTALLEEREARFLRRYTRQYREQSLQLIEPIDMQFSIFLEDNYFHISPLGIRKPLPTSSFATAQLVLLNLDGKEMERLSFKLEGMVTHSRYGRAAVFLQDESFRPTALRPGLTVLHRVEADLNGDGTIDAISRYRSKYLKE